MAYLGREGWIFVLSLSVAPPQLRFPRGPVLQDHL